MKKYEENFQKILQAETISVTHQTDLTKFREFQKLLAELFPHLWNVCDLEDFHGSIVLRWKGEDESKLPIMLMNHQDVVEENGAWTYPAFSGTIANGKIYGRGAVDTKGGLWAMLQAGDDLAAEGFIPGRDIYFESGCNEEISGDGAKEINEQLAKRGLKFALILDEGPGITNENGKLSAQIGIGEKALTDIKFIAKSAGGHASRPPKNQPLVRLGRFMAELEDHFDGIFPKKINEQTGEEQQTSVAFTMAKAANGSNVLPTEAYVIANMRSAHHQTADGSLEAITNFAKKFDLECEVLDKGFTSVIADFSSADCTMLKNAIIKMWPGIEITPTIMTGCTDCHFMSALSDNPVRFSPFTYSKEQSASIHSVDENVDLSTLEPAVDFYKLIMKGE